MLRRTGGDLVRSFVAAAAMSREPEIMESQVMWEPDTKRNTHMDRFRAAVADSCGLRLGERRAGRQALRLCSGSCSRYGGWCVSVSPRLRIPRAGLTAREGTRCLWGA